MPYCKDRLQKRNDYIIKLYNQTKRKNPKWSWIALIAEVSEMVFLAPSTVGKIIQTTDASIPCADTIIKYSRAVA